MNKIEELEQQIKAILEKIEKLKSEEKESKVWKPKEDKPYYFILSYGEVDGYNWKDDSADSDRYEIGNCFKTKKEAEKALEKLKIYTQLKRLAEDINTKPIDWDNYDQEKYRITYNCVKKQLFSYCSGTYREQGAIYCTNNVFLDIAKERIGEENLLKLFKE